MLLWFATACGSLNGMINSSNDFITYTLATLVLLAFYKSFKYHDKLYQVFKKPDERNCHNIYKVGSEFIIGFPLTHGLTESLFNRELTLLKGVYGNASSDASKRLDDHYKKYPSVLGLK